MLTRPRAQGQGGLGCVAAVLGSGAHEVGMETGVFGGRMVRGLIGEEEVDDAGLASFHPSSRCPRTRLLHATGAAGNHGAGARTNLSFIPPPQLGAPV